MYIYVGDVASCTLKFWKSLRWHSNDPLLIENGVQTQSISTFNTNIITDSYQNEWSD
jgi:hypothetical protein